MLYRPGVAGFQRYVHRDQIAALCGAGQISKDFHGSPSPKRIARRSTARVPPQTMPTTRYSIPAAVRRF
jgi:hypothetical protein